MNFIVNPLCIPTSYTTDNAVSGKTINYARGSGPVSVTLDTVISDDASCNYPSYEYSIATVASAFTFA
jgi:hypothetical protein